MDVRDHGVSARNIIPKLGNDGMSVGNSYMCVYCKLGLGVRISSSCAETMERTLKT